MTSEHILFPRTPMCLGSNGVSTGKSNNETTTITPSVGIFWGVRDGTGPCC